MVSRRSFLVVACLVSCLCLATVVSAFSPPPVFEHKADRNFKGTNCEVCQAAVKQAIKKMDYGAQKPDLSTQKLRRAREQKVSDVVESLCSVESFGRYEYSPPTMVSACNDFLSNNGEDFENLLYKGVATDREMRTRLCIDTAICDKLWTVEAEEQKRDRSPEESQREADEQQRTAKEAEKKKKAEEKAEKAAKLKAKKEAAAAAKAKREAEEAAAAEAAPAKEEL